MIVASYVVFVLHQRGPCSAARISQIAGVSPFWVIAAVRWLEYSGAVASFHPDGVRERVYQLTQTTSIDLNEARGVKGASLRIAKNEVPQLR